MTQLTTALKETMKCVREIVSIINCIHETRLRLKKLTKARLERLIMRPIKQETKRLTMVVRSTTKAATKMSIKRRRLFLILAC